MVLISDDVIHLHTSGSQNIATIKSAQVAFAIFYTREREGRKCNVICQDNENWKNFMRSIKAYKRMPLLQESLHFDVNKMHI